MPSASELKQAIKLDNVSVLHEIPKDDLLKHMVDNCLPVLSYAVSCETNFRDMFLVFDIMIVVQNMKYY